MLKGERHSNPRTGYVNEYETAERWMQADSHHDSGGKELE
jgi:hypothetical protein